MSEDLDYIAYFARTKKFDVKPRTIFVEGTTDVTLFELAAKVEKERTGIDLLGDRLAIIAAGEGDEGGAKGVCRELVSFKNMAKGCLLPNGRPKYRFVGLFDNDSAGRQAISDVRKTDTSILEFKDVFRLWPVMPLSPNLDVEAIRRNFEAENEKYKHLDWELEDLLPDSFCEIIIAANPSAIHRSFPMHDKVHHEWSSDGKAKLHRLANQYANYKDLEQVISTLRAFWHYLNIKPPENVLIQPGDEK